MAGSEPCGATTPRGDSAMDELNPCACPGLLSAVSSRHGVGRAFAFDLRPPVSDHLRAWAAPPSFDYVRPSEVSPRRVIDLDITFSHEGLRLCQPICGAESAAKGRHFPSWPGGGLPGRLARGAYSPGDMCAGGGTATLGCAAVWIGTRLPSCRRPPAGAPVPRAFLRAAQDRLARAGARPGPVPVI